MLHDSQAVNAQMIPWGPYSLVFQILPYSLQLSLTGIDLKDCFFTIPLHCKDKEKCAFSVPTIDNHRAVQRHRWKCLSRGWRRAPPPRCQSFVRAALQPTRNRFPRIRIDHDTEDIRLLQIVTPFSVHVYDFLLTQSPPRVCSSLLRK